MSIQHLRLPFAFALVSSLVLPLPAQPIQPVIREGVMEKISAHVHVIPDAGVSLVPNVGIIVGNHGTLVIDTGLGDRNGAAVVREANKVRGQTKLYLATTHFHPEHDLGARAFPAETQMIRSHDQQKDIEEFGLQLAKTFSGRSPFIAELLKDAQFRPADIRFEREFVLDLGGVRVRIIAMGANHTRGDTVAFVEPDGVLFSGDVAMRPQPSFASPYSTVRHWLTSLTFLENLKPQRIVPSHGPMGDASIITGYRTYLTTIQSRAVALKKEGKSADDAIKVIADELSSAHPDRARLTGAARAAYNETP